MSNLQDSASTTSTIVCKEVFDETSHPSNEEIFDYAKRLGIDPETEPHLLYLARDGLMEALPKGWSPCYHPTSKAWYYYQASSKTTSWEHPLDARYKELVHQARSGIKRQPSLDDDSKTTAKDLESHEDISLPTENSTLPPPVATMVHVTTKIPTKLASLKHSDSKSWRKLAQTKSPTNDSSSLTPERSSVDYTNRQFQDPMFYECPKFLAYSDKEINLHEIVRRSESMSPRYEKDWEQLSSKFSSEENVIDIDKLSVSSLTKSESNNLVVIDKKFENKVSKQSSHQKELKLSGGGSMFLKSNRSRDNTLSQDVEKCEEYRSTISSIEVTGSPDRPKSILRDKPGEDDDRPMDEDMRKSVRFDLEADMNDIKFLYSDSDKEDWKLEVEMKVPEVKLAQSNITNSPKTLVRLRLDDKPETLAPISKRIETKKSSLYNENSSKTFRTNRPMINHRFIVQNVSELEHLNQISRKNSSENSDREESKSVSTFEEIQKRKGLTLTITKDQPVKNDNLRNQNQVNQTIKLQSSDTISKQDSVEQSQQSFDLPDESCSTIMTQHESEIVSLKKDLELKLEQTKRDLEKEFIDQKLVMERDLERRLIELRQQLMQKDKEGIQKLIAEMDDVIPKKLEKSVSEQQESISENPNLNQTREAKNLPDNRQNSLEPDVGQYPKKIETIKTKLDIEYDDLRNDLRTQQRERVTKMTLDHEKCLAEILRDFRVEETMARKVYKQRLDEIRADFDRELNKEVQKISERVTRQETIDFEKIRCEKRLLEDKYKILKEKYLKLKNDVRLAVEKRSKRKENSTTASETDRSGSAKTRTDKTKSFFQKKPSSNASFKPAEEINQNSAEKLEAKKSLTFQLMEQESSMTPGMFELDDTTTASETMNSNIILKKKIPSKETTKQSTHNNNNTENPVENIRKQFEKLEDLGDQLPTNESAYTLRYPFQDEVPVNASSELEFFKHRIHVERDSVKRAREILKTQKCFFHDVEKAWKQRSTTTTLEQFVQEQREISEMEISLHRTKSLMGEKVIHLKHLKQSLEKVANAKKHENEVTLPKTDEVTISDVSSASSGFSSTEIGTDTFVDKSDYHQELTEIITSFENLNWEIQEIWNVLNKRRGNTVPPPPTLIYSDLRWMHYQHLTTQPNNVSAPGTPNIQSNILSQLTHPPTTTTQNIISQYGPNSSYTTSVGPVERGTASLIERTRNLRDWLRQARIETTDFTSQGQTTL